MTLKTVVVIAAVASGVQAHVARAQSITTEAAITAGKSSEEEVKAVATQLRAFGELQASIRYYVEAAWARSSDDDSDAFGAAYPYRNQVQVIEAYGERVFQRKSSLFIVRAGRYRTPFGIYNASDHAYTGFLRAPLLRYDGYWALSNNYLEHGADVVVGVPRLTFETSLSAPADVGATPRRPGLDAVVRVQGLLGPAIIGVSYLRTSPYKAATFAKGRSHFTGLDVRWMREGVQFRGEWIAGPWSDGTTTTGWYADAIVHHVGMGPVTAVARVEGLNFDTVSGFAVHSKRQTVGARVRILEGLSAAVNVHHHTGLLHDYGRAAVDAGVTYSVRR